MQEAATPKANTGSQKSLTRQISRLVAGTVLLTAMVACTTVPSESANSGSVHGQTPKKGLASANAMYNTRNYGGAVREFDTIISAADASAYGRRLSHLGKALIYLGSDENWRSIESAKMSLNAASQVIPEGNEAFSVETNLFMDSIAALINSESEYLELQAKSSDSSAEITRLEKERNALAKERDELLKEQQTLNEAIEKLKNLTLGS